jgi:hypothetical protein
VSGPYRLRSCSPLRRRPDAATWPTARDVSQRAEPDVRPLGRASPAFIADKARRLSIPLAGDVSPQHLICPVHSADGRRPGHPAGGMPVHRAGQKTCNPNPEYPNPNPNPKYPKPEFCSGISCSNLQNPNLFRVIRVSQSGTRITQTFMCHVLMSCLIINLYIYNYV